MDAEAVVRVLDLIERVSRAEAERDAVAEILGTLAPGGSIVNMAEAARNALEFRGQQLAERDATIARLKATVSDKEVHLFSEIAVVYTCDGKQEEFKHFDRHAIDELLAHRYAV